MKTYENKLRAGALYLGDGGRCFCATHAGMAASMTGRDLSGQRVHEVTEAEQRAARKTGWPITCEGCRQAERRKAEALARGAHR